MGKVLKVAAGVIGVAALVIPGVGPMITGTLGGFFAGGNAALLAGGAAAAAAHGIAATVTSALMMAGSPVADMVPLDNFRPGGMVSRNTVIECMLPIRRWWHATRYRLAIMNGKCMEPHVKNGRWLLIDHTAEIRAGDLVAIKTTGGRVLKRFVQLGAEGLIVETTTPCTQRYYIPLDKVRWVYRARACGKTRADVMRAIMNIANDPDAHSELLANIVDQRDRELV